LRQQVFQQVREAIWGMKGSADIDQVWTPCTEA
jgi:hypothetical protein